MVQSQTTVQHAAFLVLRRRASILGRQAAVAALTVALAACNGVGSSPTESVLYSFGTGNNGKYPNGGLVMDASGNLYGTTSFGGTYNKGTVFKITPSGVESVLYSFGPDNDEHWPNGGLVMDASGNLYGTTAKGGTYNKGTVFKITPSGVESVLYSFGNGNNGKYPNGGLLMDASGNLYGTTERGGTNNFGTVFKITSSGVESVLHSFGKGNDGVLPNGGMLMDASGTLYGTTSVGGTVNSGTVFKITPSGVESVLHSFGTGNDGQQPNGGLVMGASSTLYGTTGSGGTDDQGTVFKITPSGIESVLHSFGTGNDGHDPNGGLVMDASGNLYGTTVFGGKRGGRGIIADLLRLVFVGRRFPGLGTVFKITPSGTESVLYFFSSAHKYEQSPNGGLVMDASGNLYGTTPGVYGTVFKLRNGHRKP